MNIAGNCSGSNYNAADVGNLLSRPLTNASIAPYRRRIYIYHHGVPPVIQNAPETDNGKGRATGLVSTQRISNALPSA